MKTKLLSAVLSVSILTSTLPFYVSATEGESKVRILVENNTFSVSDGAVWEGVLIDEWVDLEQGMSAADIFNNTLSAHGYTQTGASDNWITDINGLSASADAAGMGGWMVGLDDWYGNGGIGTLSLENGDELMLSYSLSWGSDIGYDYTSDSTKLSSLTFDKGELSPAFSPDVTEYTLKLDENDNTVHITPTAENKGFRYKIYKNEYTPDTENTDIKRTADITAENGDEIFVGVGHKEWHSYYSDNASETVYKITVNAESTPISEPDKKDDEEKPQIKEIVDFDTMFSETTDTIKKSASLTEAGNEWQILGLARTGQLSKEDRDKYAENLSSYLKDTELNKATDCAKYALVKASIGEDFSDMTEKLSDYDFAVKQGINGALYTLLAVSAKESGFAAVSSDTVQNSEEALIKYMLELQQDNGGWAFFGDAYEPDMTGMVLQSLAPYYKKDDAVTNAVDKALELLSSTMNDDCTFTSYGAANSESSSQVIIALAALGIDPENDERFVNGEHNLISGLSQFYKKGEGMFSHGTDEDVNALSTLQAFTALCAYKRFKDGQTAFYDMSDVETVKKDITPEPVQTDDNNKKSDNTNENENSTAAKDNEQPVNGTVPTGDRGISALVFIIALSFVTAVVCRRKKNEN